MPRYSVPVVKARRAEDRARWLAFSPACHVSVRVLVLAIELAGSLTTYPKFRAKFQTRAFLPAGRTAFLPRLARHSWYATSIGAATAIDE
jgi:hypothetical protein